ncbi:hypothetical protein Tco_0714033 [Tanacetum coccineum]
MDPYNHTTNTSTKLPILDSRKFEQWKFKIQQYLQHEHYALWEVIEFGNSYKVPPEEPGKAVAGEASEKKKGRIVAITTEDMQKRRNDEAILKTFGGNEATKKTKKNQLKQQYGNFKAEGSETLEQTFNRLQAIVSHLEFIDVPIEKDDLNQKFLTSLEPEWLMYTIVWRNRDDLDTMSLDDLYNYLKVYKPKVQKKAGSNSQNMAFISSSNTNSGKGEVPTASVPTASSQVSTISTKVAAASLSHDTICAFIATQSNGSQIKYEDITQIDQDDIEEMDIKWNFALLSMRADRWNASIATKWIILLESAEHQEVNTEEREKATGLECRAPLKEKHLLGKDFLMQNKACYKCGYFDHLASNYGIWVAKGETWPRGNYSQNNVKSPSTHKSMTPRVVLLKSGSKPIVVNKPKMNVAQPTMTSFKTAHSNVKRPFERKIAAKNQIWVLKVPTGRTKIPTVGLNVPTAKPTGAADLGNNGKAVKALAHWIWKPKENTSGQSSNFNGGNIDDKGYWDSGCSRHMTGNKSYLFEYDPYDGGYVSFGHGGGKITGKGTIKTGYTDVRTAKTPMDKENPWGKDGPGKDVDLHLYRSMVGSLMYLTTSRPYIMFAVYVCARHQVTPKECHLHVVKRIFRYLKGQPLLGLWYPKESPFDLLAYSDSDYDGDNQDRKSTTGGCQFLGRRLIFWQCKKADYYGHLHN